jgi:hypothetical protein
MGKERKDGSLHAVLPRRRRRRRRRRAFNKRKSFD